jgi:hypothetical protein
MALKTLNQMLTDNPNLLSFVVVPESAQEDLDAATLKTAIIRRCGDVEPYYQKTTDFVLFGAMWFSTHGFLFDHAIEVWNTTYNPIENYNRLEDETVTGTRETSGANTDTHSGTDTTTTSGSASGSDTHSGTDTTTTSGSKSGSEAHTGTDTITDNVTRENEIAGFDSSTYQDANKETEAGTHSTAHGETVTTSGQESGSESVAHGEVITKAEQSSGSEALAHGHKIETESEGTEESETTRASHIHGNIGVTTSQQMIEAELALADKFWIYDYIASAFETDNFITVYKSYYDII